jgi:hypothetical protein
MSKQPKWWLKRLEEMEACIACLSACDAEDTNISIFDDGQDLRLLYGHGAIRIKGINLAVFSAYLAARFRDRHLCVHALGDARPVTKELLQRIEETIDLTVGDARRMLALQTTPEWREVIRAQRPKRRPVAKPCSICHELTDDQYALSAPNAGYPIVCPGCKIREDILEGMQRLGWLSADGKLTPEFRRARKRHYHL